MAESSRHDAPPPPPQMQKPLNPKFTILVVLSVVLIVGAIFWFIRSRARPQAIPAQPTPRAPAAALLTATPPPLIVTPAASAPLSSATPATRAPAATLTPAPPTTGVAIQEGKTIDFSSGKPVVKDSPEEKESIARSVKEMDAAASEITFGPPGKKPVTAPTPPK